MGVDGAPEARGCARASLATNCVRASAARPPSPQLRCGASTPCLKSGSRQRFPQTLESLGRRFPPLHPAQRKVEAVRRRRTSAGLPNRGKPCFPEGRQPDALPPPGGVSTVPPSDVRDPSCASWFTSPSPSDHCVHRRLPRTARPPQLAAGEVPADVPPGGTPVPGPWRFKPPRETVRCMQRTVPRPALRPLCSPW